MIFGYKPAQLKKLGVALLGFVLTVVSVALEGNLIPASWLPYVVAFIGVCSSYGVFKVRNVSRQAVAYSSDTLPPASESGTV